MNERPFIFYEDVMDYIYPLGKLIYPYLNDISVALIACALVVFGSDINAFLRRRMRQQHFIIRTIAFILLNAFGYGFVIVKLSPYLARTLKHLDKGMMFAIVVASFVLIGLWAQRNRQI
jgi:hypothetical protein